MMWLYALHLIWCCCCSYTSCHRKTWLPVFLHKQVNMTHKDTHTHTRRFTFSTVDINTFCGSISEWRSKKSLEITHSFYSIWLWCSGESECTEVQRSQFKWFPPHFYVLIFPAVADATETSCQPAETEHGLKVGIFPKGKLPQESTRSCMSHEHRSMEEWQSNLSENLYFCCYWWCNGKKID